MRQGESDAEQEEVPLVTITQQDLEKTRLWQAANALRGPVDPADFKTYVAAATPSLFIALRDHILPDVYRSAAPSDSYRRPSTE